jgi:hypothetical protein
MAEKPDPKKKAAPKKKKAAAKKRKKARKKAPSRGGARPNSGSKTEEGRRRQGEAVQQHGVYSELTISPSQRPFLDAVPGLVGGLEHEINKLRLRLLGLQSWIAEIEAAGDPLEISESSMEVDGATMQNGRPQGGRVKTSQKRKPKLVYYVELELQLISRIGRLESELAQIRALGQGQLADPWEEARKMHEALNEMDELTHPPPPKSDNGSAGEISGNGSGNGHRGISPESGDEEEEDE